MSQLIFLFVVLFMGVFIGAAIMSAVASSKKPRKSEANYRLPEHCCATCDHSGFNTMDDPICKKLNAFEAVVDFGGVCDDHMVEGVKTFNA